MYVISKDIYKIIAEELMEAFSDGGYYSGVVEIETAELSCRFISSLILYRKIESLPEGEVSVLSDIIPVWWEMQIFTDEGEVVSDFDFGELKNCMIVW